MVTQHKEPPLSIVDAVETLSQIADLEFDREVGVAKENDLILQDRKVTYRTVHWLDQEDPEGTVKLVRQTFRTILIYLKEFYEKEHGKITDDKTIEGIKTIMVLVGEAAKKLDRYTTLFHTKKIHSIVDLREYKQLQRFYHSKIARKVDQGLLGKWILMLAETAKAKRKKIKLKAKTEFKTKNVFIDLEGVKKDMDYELFFLRKEDGTWFFSPRLIRNIKLVCDFGSYFDGKKGDDPLEDAKFWYDYFAYESAQSLIKSMGYHYDRYFHEAVHSPKQELAKWINKAMVALYLAANPENAAQNCPVKCCYEYFHDFQAFLRKGLLCRQYQKIIAYPPGKSDRVAICLMDTIHAFCRGMHGLIGSYRMLLPIIEDLLQEAEELIDQEQIDDAESTLWGQLSTEYDGMLQLMRRHPNGPLEKVLDYLESGAHPSYDTLIQSNIPNQWYAFYLHDRRMLNLHLPSPTHQEFIHKAQINHEFYGFLRSAAKDQTLNKILIFNLQDRTSWREYARAKCLEELNGNKEFKKQVSVVSLTKDTEFYYQTGPYFQDTDAQNFIHALLENLSDENAGCVFPQEIKTALFPNFVEDLLHTVHRIFFGHRNILTREERRDFIEITYMMIQLKILDIVKPDAFAFVSKDGVDSGAVASAELYAFLAIVGREDPTDVDREVLHSILYGPSILLRERIIHAERFHRMIHCLKRVEDLREELGAENFHLVIEEGFESFFDGKVFSMTRAMPHE